MSENTGWPTIPAIVDGSTPLNNAGLQPIIDALETRTETLQAAMMTHYDEGTVISDSGLQNCAKGQLVAFDATTNSYIPAQPDWTTDSAGKIVPDTAAYIAGIVYTAPDISGVAQLLLSGVVDGSELGLATPGEYYLDVDGTLSQGVPIGKLPVYCGYLTARGVFVFRPASPVYDGHRHTQYQLTGGEWGETTGGYVYDDANDPTCQTILSSLPVTSILVVSDGSFIGNPTLTSNGQLKIASDTQPTDVTLFGVNPLATVNPEVTAVAPALGNNVVKATRTYGTVYLDTEYPVSDSNSLNGRCITSISRTGITTGPVVQQIVQGPGIEVVNNDGVYTLSAGWFSRYLDMQTINANNVLVGSTATDALITFPAGITSTLIGVVRVPASENPWTIHVFAWMLDAGGTLTGNILIQPPPTGGAAVSTTSEISISGSGSAGAIIEALSTNTYSAPGDSLVTITLTATPGTAIRLRAAGIKLSTNAG